MKNTRQPLPALQSDIKDKGHFFTCTKCCSSGWMLAEILVKSCKKKSISQKCLCCFCWDRMSSLWKGNWLISV